MNEFLDKNVHQGHTFNYFFRTFNDLWGARSPLESCGQFCEIYAKKIHKNIMTSSYFTGFRGYHSNSITKHIKSPSKIYFSIIFLCHLMTSGVKDHCYKVLDNLVNVCTKNLSKNFVAGLWFTSFKSYKFKCHHHIYIKISVKGQSFNNFFGHLMTS